MTVLAVLTVSAVLESPRPSLRLSCHNTGQRGNRDGFGVLAAVAVVTASPLKLNPLFPTS